MTKPFFRKLITSVSALALAASGTVALAGPDAMTAQEARHLIARTGFGAAPHEVAALTGMSYEAAVVQILDGVTGDTTHPQPDWTTSWMYPYEDIWALGQTAEELFYTNRYLEIEDLAAWWMAEMVATPSPLTERLTLFWHDHFATSFEDIENTHWMAAQHRLLRNNAAGNFAVLADGILRDPAMLTYLTNIDNSKEEPNENLAREYFELFTLGEGRGYSEADIRDAARALTGHSVADIGTPTYTFYGEAHDFGHKTILGHTGAFDAGDLPGLALGHPDFGPYIVEKLWRAFISDQPDPAEVQRLSDMWKASGLELKPLLREMFLGDAFWDPANRGRLVKSPVELMVSTVRTTGIEVPASHLVWSGEDLGQILFAPPNVGGWPEGAAWITDAAALARSTLLLETTQAYGDTLDAYASPAVDDGLPVVAAGPDDFRVGQIFAAWAEAWDDGGQHRGAWGGAGVAVTLFDVSIGGDTIRSIPLWIEEEAGEDPFITLFTGDCAPGCFAGVEEEGVEDGWLFFSPAGYAEEAWPEGLTAADEALLSAIMTHLPTLFARTETQRTWSPEWAGEDGETVPQFAEIRPLVASVAQAGIAALGQSDTTLVVAQSRPGTLGVNGLGRLAALGGSEEDREEAMIGFYEMQAEAAMRPATPSVTYDSAEDWIAALPEGMTPEALLLAVPMTTQTDLDSLSAEDRLTRILLSPEYQVN